MIRWSPTAPTRPACPHRRLTRLLGAELGEGFALGSSTLRPWASANFVGARHLFRCSGSSLDARALQDRLAARVTAEGISVRGLEEIVSMGVEDEAPRVQRKRPVAPGLEDLAERLSDRLETRVKVDLGKAKGKITVEFASMDDLRRIVDVMDPRNRNDRPI